MKAIVAVDSKWGIGYRGNLLQRIPEDMKFFKEKTLGKVIIMGRQTFESLPNGEPLKGRVNIVLSKDLRFNNEKLIICRSLEKLLQKIKEYNSEDIFVIGGESIYFQLLPYCTEIFVTKINKTFIADKHFPNLDKNNMWKQVAVSEDKLHKDIEFNFVKYEKKSNNNVDIIDAALEGIEFNSIKYEKTDLTL